MDVEFVSFSSATVATLRRLVSNVAATHPDVQHRSIRRTSRAYTQRIGAGSQAESWLTQRHWRVTGERLTFVGTRDGARSALLELLSPVATSSAGNQRTSPVAASAELVARVRSTIVELTSKGLWFFKCVFRFSADEFVKSFMGGDVTLDAGAVESALMVVANDATLVLPGALTYDGNAGMRVFCYVYQ